MLTSRNERNMVGVKFKDIDTKLINLYLQAVVGCYKHKQALARFQQHLCLNIYIGVGGCFMVQRLYVMSHTFMIPIVFLTTLTSL